MMTSFFLHFKIWINQSCVPSKWLLTMTNYGAFSSTLTSRRNYLFVMWRNTVEESTSTNFTAERHSYSLSLFLIPPILNSSRVLYSSQDELFSPRTKCSYEFLNDSSHKNHNDHFGSNLSQYEHVQVIHSLKGSNFLLQFEASLLSLQM